MNILKYLNLALEVAGVVEGFISLFAAPGPVSGASIALIAQPGISAIAAVFPKVNIPAQLVTDVSNAAADAINSYFKKSASA